MERNTPVVAFICTHNACRSQIAEAVARTWAKDAFIPCSAGTNPVASVNNDALRILRDRYGIDASQQHPKTLAELPTVDFVVTMGCGVACPGIVAEPHTGCSTPAFSPLAAHIVYTPPAHAKEGRRSDPLHSSRRRLWHCQDDGAIDAANASHMLTSVRTAVPANPGTPRHARIRPAPPADA